MMRHYRDNSPNNKAVRLAEILADMEEAFRVIN